MKQIPDGSMIGFEAKYSFRHLITKPFHYLIQLGTGSKIHHEGIMCDGLLYEAMASTGVRGIALQYKLDEVSNCIKTHVFEPQNKLSKTKVDKLRVDLGKQLGKKYSALEAVLSIISVILLQRKVTYKEMFCSKLVFYAYRNLFPKKLKKYIPRTMNPEEVKKVLQKEGLLKESYILEI
jgi:hypothetical protein